MISSGIAFISLVILLLVENTLTENPWVIGGIGFIGVSLGGIKMFAKALASVKNRQFGFQVSYFLSGYWGIISARLGKKR